MDASRYKSFREVLARQLQQALHDGDELRAYQTLAEQFNLKSEYYYRKFGLSSSGFSLTLSSI